MSARSGGNESDLDRRMARLATERGALFDKAGASFGLLPKSIRSDSK